MGKQQNKRNKETSVSDVEKKEEQLNSEETIEETSGEQQLPEGTEGDNTDGGEEGAEGEEGSSGEEPPASGSEDESGVDGSGSDEGETNAGDSDVVAAAEPAEPAVVQPLTTLAQLAEASAPVAPASTVRSDKADAIIGYIREYVVAMDPSKYQDAKSGVPRQKRLYTMLGELAKLEFLDFKIGMDNLLKLIFEYRHAAFSELYIRRFFENLYPSLTHEQVREFDDLLSILVTVGSATNRSRAMTQVDLGAALKSIKNPKAQQNMSAYFSALR
ncbi:hypothetical protein pEaSNUABM37_00322 [Erwinia phage pEa_SNUABM_37]|nr:hypothetical protein pEaSNUABM37_00322 [Erwinia phage pEa_SNUABM_37]QXO10790.1 hypothetical protein pEaSNUABM48_00322 [Erwinia phage pEa_SNUABM_48]